MAQTRVSVQLIFMLLTSPPEIKCEKRDVFLFLVNPVYYSVQEMAISHRELTLPTSKAQLKLLVPYSLGIASSTFLFLKHQTKFKRFSYIYLPSPFLHLPSLDGAHRQFEQERSYVSSIQRFGLIKF